MRAESRVTGIASRLLYQYAMWRAAARPNDTDALRTHKVCIEANGYDVFRDRCAQACALMGFDVVETVDASSADLVFVYVAPPGEARTDAQFATFERVVAHHRDATDATDVDALPLFCFLLGEADFLAPPSDDETERLRGLSEFAIAQQLHPRMQDAAYRSIAQFAVEFTPDAAAPADQDAKQAKLQQLMKGFGCVDHNLMHYTEKWEFYAPAQSALCRDDDALLTPQDSETRYWLERAKDRTCHYCHAGTTKLARCARCQDARYCSRECQRAAWAFHKRLCGKTPEEISS